MYLFKKQGVPWPPIGWKHFSSIKKTTGQSLSKNPRTATIQGLSYHVEGSPVYLDNKKLSYIYTIRIEGWTYSIQNESHEYPIMQFTLMDKTDVSLEKAPYVSDLKIQARPFSLDEGRAHRTIMTALFFMKQIDGNNVPDYEQVLRLYRLTPNALEKKRDTRKRPSLLSERPQKRLSEYLMHDKDLSNIN